MKNSNLLIGSNNNQDKISKFLIGNIRDKDKDGYILGFSKFVDDCNDSNKNEDGWLSDTWKAITQPIVNIIQPKPTPAPAPIQTLVVSQPVSKPSPFTPTPSPFTPKKPVTTTPSYPSGAGYSYIEPTTGKGVYQLPSGEKVEVTPETTSAINLGAETVSQIKIAVPEYKTPQEKAYEEFQKKISPPSPFGVIKPTPTVKAYQTGIVPPYQTRGTISTAPVKDYLPYKIEPQPIKLKDVYEVLTMPSKVATYISELPAKERPYKEGEVFQYQPVTPPVSTARRETVTYQPSPLTPTGKYIKESLTKESIEINKVEINVEQKVGEIYNKGIKELEDKIKSGNYNQSQIDTLILNKEKELDTRARIQVDKLNTQYKTEYDTREADRLSKLKKEEFKDKYWRQNIGTLISAGLYVTPYISGVLIGSTIAEAVPEVPSIFKGITKEISKEGVAGVGVKFVKSPEALRLATDILIYGGVGKGVGIVKGISKETKVAAALRESKILIEETKGISVDTFLKELRISEGKKAEIKKLAREGYDIRFYETKIKPAVGYEKYTPDIKGKFGEIVNRQGQVIETIGMGEIEAKLGRKIIKKQIEPIRGIGQIDDSGVKLLTEARVYERKVLNPITGKLELRKPEVQTFYQESKILETAKKKILKESKYLTPSEYAKKLEREGKIMRISYTDEQWKALGFPSEDLAKFVPSKFSNYPEMEGLILTRESEGISKISSERKLAHELVHYKTQGRWNEAVEKSMDYYKRPSEIMAMKYEGILSERGFKQPNKYKKLNYVKSETETELLGIKKYSGKPLLEKYGKFETYQLLPKFEEIKGTGKKLTKGQFIEESERVSKTTKGLTVSNLITGETIGLGTKKVISKSTGRGFAEFIKEEPKKVRTSKRWYEEVPKEVPKTRKVPFTPVKSEIIKSQELIEPSYIRGGEVGLEKQGLYYGQSFKVPYSGEALSYSLGSEFPSIVRKGIETFETFKGLAIGGIVGVSGVSRERVDTGMRTRTGLLFANRELEIEKEKPRVIEKPIQVTSLSYDTANIFKVSLREEQIQKQKEELKLIQKQKFKTPESPKIPPFTFIPEFPKRPRIEFPDEERTRREEENIGYNAEVYIDSTKKRKAHWQRLNKLPLTKKSALSESSRVVDETISARGRVIKSKSKQRPINTGEDYFGINRYKFRDYKVTKGAKTKLPNQFIELRKYRLDSPNEKIKIKQEKSKALNIRNAFGF